MALEPGRHVGVVILGWKMGDAINAAVCRNLSRDILDNGGGGTVVAAVSSRHDMALIRHVHPQIDALAVTRGLGARQVIETLGTDPHIGSDGNNPSFGFGGYCLPRDSKQLLANFIGVPRGVIGSIVEANAARTSACAAGCRVGFNPTLQARHCRTSVQIAV